MADTPKAPTKAPKAPVQTADDKNAESGEQVTEVAGRSEAEEAVGDAVAASFHKTANTDIDASAILGEVKDQLNTELKAVQRQGSEESETLIRERMDHQETLARALGIKGEDGRSKEDKRKEAEERLEAISENKRDTSKDDVLNARPANWTVVNKGDGKISAVNRITGETYEGATKDFLKK